MKLLDKIISPFRAKATTPLSIRDPNHWRNRMDGPPDYPMNENNALALSAVWACVNLIAGTGSTLPPMVYRAGPQDQRKVDRKHPLFRVLHDRPSSLQTPVDFWEHVFASIELWGNSFNRVVRRGDDIVAIIPVNPALPTVKWAGNELSYEWTEDGKSYRETSRSMLHIRGFGGGPLGGLSTLALAARAFRLQDQIERAAQTTFENGMRPSLGITFPAWLTDVQRGAVERALLEKYTGAMNAGRPFLMEGGMDVKEFSIKPEDAQMLQSRAFGVEEICRFFGIPPHMIGHTEKASSWGTGLAEQTLGFMKFNLRRRAKRVEAAINQQLRTPADIESGVFFEFNFEGLLRADSAGRAQYYREMTQIGAMTINEVRALENLPPVEGGDVPRMQQQNVPINAPAPPPAPPPQA